MARVSDRMPLKSGFGRASSAASIRCSPSLTCKVSGSWRKSIMPREIRRGASERSANRPIFTVEEPALKVSKVFIRATPSTGWGAAGRHRIGAARQHYGDMRHGHEPSRRRAGEVDQLLGRHVVGFGIRHEQDVGLARDGETMPLVRAASKLRALSKASGPSTLAPVICPRAAITVSAAVSSRRRHLGVHGLHGGEHRDFRILHAEPAQEIDRVLADVPLVLQRRLDVDRCVGDDEQLVVGRDVHGIDMAVRNGNDLDTVERDLCGLGGGEKVYIALADERDDRGGIAGLNLVESLVA